MRQRIFREAKLTTLGLVTIAMLTVSLQGCAWFRKGDDKEKGMVEMPADYEGAGAGTSTRPEDAPLEVPRPTGLRPAEPLQVIYFDFDRAEIRPDQIARLDHNLTYLLEDGEVKVLVEGHCDERGTTEYNFALGERRARAVQDYFVRNGVSPARVQIISKGEEEPADPGHDEEAWAKNRRTEFKFFN